MERIPSEHSTGIRYFSKWRKCRVEFGKVPSIGELQEYKKYFYQILASTSQMQEYIKPVYPNTDLLSNNSK